jgi:hypothetical protein
MLKEKVRRTNVEPDLQDQAHGRDGTVPCLSGAGGRDDIVSSTTAYEHKSVFDAHYRRTRYARWKPSRCDGSTPDGGYLASHPMSELEAMHVKYERDGSISNLVKAIRQLMATICPFLDLRQIHAASI